MKAIKFFIAMWQILFATLAVYSQTTITGHVYIDKEPVFAATVFLANHHQVNTITNENGFFSMNVPDSIQKDTLIVCYLGYKDYKAPLTDWKEPHMIHLELNFSITTLSEIVIQTDLTASKEFAASQLDRTAIYMTPAAGADPLRAVTLQPYSTNTEESANPQLRGSLGNYSRVFINNVPIKNPVRNQLLNGIGNFSLFSADISGKEFVYPSNPPLEYGNSIGGIVALHTTESLSDKHETNLSMSLANLGIFHSTQINEKSFIQVYGNRQLSEPYKWINKSSLDYLDKFAATDGGINLRTALSSKSYINGFAYVIKENYRAERGTYNFLGMQDARNLRNFDILNFRLITAHGALGINASWDMAHSNFYYGSISDTTAQKNLFISASYKHYFPHGLTISAGGDYEHNSYKYHGVYPTTIHETGNLTATHHGAGNIQSNKVETYVYVKWLIDNVILSASIRNVLQAGTKSRWSYQTNMKYNLSNKHSLTASFGHYNALSLPDYFMRQSANATSRQLSLDWKSHLTAKCEISAATYWKKESLPQQFMNITEYEFVNNHILRIELYGKYAWPCLEMSGSYSFLQAKMKYRNKKFPSDNDFKHMAKVMLSYLNPKVLNAAISCQYRGGLPYTPVTFREDRLVFGNLNSGRYNDYFTLDLSINRFFRIGKIGLVVFATITNITNHANQQNFFYSGDNNIQHVKYYNKRLFYVGYSVRL